MIYWLKRALHSPRIILYIIVCISVSYAIAGAKEKKNKHYNIRTGALKLNFTGTFSIESNDNITSSGVEPKRDIILRPGFTVEGEYRLSDINLIELKMGLNYSKFLKHSELDSRSNSIDMDRNSKVQFIVRMDPITYTLSDTFHFTADPTDAFSQDSSGNIENNVDSFARIENTLKLEANADLQDININLGLSRMDYIPLGSEFSFTQRTEYQEVLHVVFILDPTFMPGFKAGLKQNEYKENFQNNSNGFFFGPTVEWKLSKLLSMDADVTYSETKFKNNGNNGDTSQSKAINGSVRVKHRMNKSYTHSVKVSLSTGVGSISNSTRVFRADYDWAWRLFKRSTLEGKMGYERSKDSGGSSPEKFNRHTASISWLRSITKRSTLSLSYAYSNKTSNINSRTFKNNRSTLSYIYDF